MVATGRSCTHIMKKISVPNFAAVLILKERATREALARPYQGYLRWLSLKPKSLCLEANVENLHDDEEFEKYLPMAWATTLFSSFFYLIQRILLILNYSGELRLFKAFVEFSDNISYFFYIILHNFVGCT